MGWARLVAISDEELVAGLEGAVGTERRATVEVIVRLCEVEQRKLHLAMGYSSLYKFCVERLGYSEDGAYYRMRAARAALSVPAILGHLQSGELSLSAVVALAPHLEEHGSALVEEARGKSKREVQRMVAELVPAPVANRTKIRPLAGHKVEIEMVADDDLEELIQEALALDRHIDPSGDVSKLMERCLRFYISERHRRKNARVCRPRARKADKTNRGARSETKTSPATAARTSPATETKTTPAEDRRRAMDEAGGRCTYVSPDGHRCTETGFLEFDHEHPRALGGSHETVRVLCRAHNQYVADLAFGREFMEEHRR